MSHCFRIIFFFSNLYFKTSLKKIIYRIVDFRKRLNAAVGYFLPTESYAVCCKNKAHAVGDKFPVLKLNCTGILNGNIICAAHLAVDKRYLVAIADSLVKFAEIQSALRIRFAFLKQ